MERRGKSEYPLTRVQLLLLGVVATFLTIAAASYLPPGIDWHQAFRPASLALLSGESPYAIEKFYAAPWGLLPLIPLALLPENIGRGLLFTISVFSLAFVALRMKARPLAFAAFLLSPTVIHGLLNANVDWLAMLGFVLPPQIGLLLILIKPQVGIGLALFWLVAAWREGGYQKMFHVFWPVVLVTLISFGLFGLWPLRFQGIISYSENFNASLWPSSLPIGLALMVTAIRNREARYAIAASPCFAPHVIFHSYAGALAAVLPATAETVVAVIGLWIVVFLRAFSGAL